MNDAALIPDGMHYLSLPVEWGTLDLYGRLIDTVDNDRGRRVRWAQICLYEYYVMNPEENDVSGQHMFLVYTIGHSVVYHEFDSPCNKGIEVRASDFYQLGTPDYPVATEYYKDLESCEICDPELWRSVPGDTVFEVEVTWYRYKKCRTGDDVLLALQKETKCKKCFHKPHEHRACNCGCDTFVPTAPQLSIPGIRLVNQVKRTQPEIAQAAARSVRL